MFNSVRLLAILAGALALVGVALPGEARANAVLDWNVVGFDATTAGGRTTSP